jgi:hypothetical protein
MSEPVTSGIQSKLALLRYELTEIGEFEYSTFGGIVAFIYVAYALILGLAFYCIVGYLYSFEVSFVGYALGACGVVTYLYMARGLASQKIYRSHSLYWVFQKTVMAFWVGLLFSLAVFFVAEAFSTPPKLPTSLYGVTLGDKMSEDKIKAVTKNTLVLKVPSVNGEVGDKSHLVFVDSKRPKSEVAVTLNEDSEVIRVRVLLKAKNNLLEKKDVSDMISLYKVYKGVTERMGDEDRLFPEMLSPVDYNALPSGDYDGASQVFFDEEVVEVFKERYWVAKCHDECIRAFSVHHYESSDDVVHVEIILQDLNAVKAYVEASNMKSKSVSEESERVREKLDKIFAVSK